MNRTGCGQVADADREVERCVKDNLECVRTHALLRIRNESAEIELQPEVRQEVEGEVELDLSLERNGGVGEVYGVVARRIEIEEEIEREQDFVLVIAEIESWIVQSEPELGLDQTFEVLESARAGHLLECVCPILEKVEIVASHGVTQKVVRTHVEERQPSVEK